MKIILLDTNFLVSALKNKINIDLELDRIINERYEKVIIDKTIDELEKLNTPESKLSISILNSQNIKKIKSTRNDVDYELIKNSNSNTLVATLDKELIIKLREKGVRIITIRQKKTFQIR